MLGYKLSTMRYRKLGETGDEVSELGFGSWGIGKQFWKGGIDEESVAALKLALARGVTFFDTALVYGRGHSERLIGRVLKKRDDVLVASKIPPKNMHWPAQGRLAEAFPPEHLRRSLELTLQNLGREWADLIQLHVWNPEWLSDTSWLDCLEELRQAGKARYIGVSANDHDPDSVIGLVESGRIDTVQVIYNIFDQTAADRLFDTCRERGVGVIARVPFDEGALTGNVTARTVFPKKDWRNRYFEGRRRQEVEERVDALRDLLGEEVRSLPELALRFCLSNPAVSTVIAGMRSTRHLESNLIAANKGPLSSALLRRLQHHRWNKNFY